MKGSAQGHGEMRSGPHCVLQSCPMLSHRRTTHDLLIWSLIECLSAYLVPEIPGIYII